MIATMNNLLNCHAGKVYWLALYLTGNAEDAEYVLQNTFLQLHAYLTRSPQHDVSCVRLAAIVFSEVLAILQARDLGKRVLLISQAELGAALVAREIVHRGRKRVSHK